MAEVPVRDLRNDTAGVLRRVEAGEDVVLTVKGAPVARIIPISSRRNKAMTAGEFFRRLDRLGPDPTLLEDLAALGSVETDTVGPW